MCFKEHQNLESKCELAKEKVDSEHGQNQKYPGPVSRPGYPFHFYLRTNIWMGLLDLGDIDREVTEIGWHVTFVTPRIIS